MICSVISMIILKFKSTSGQVVEACYVYVDKVGNGLSFLLFAVLVLQGSVFCVILIIVYFVIFLFFYEHTNLIAVTSICILWWGVVCLCMIL